ncbi:hypothetical protein [Microbispora sp. H10949]|uniref:hypothetical protein n=1 Tax=Microbispora sp. H10949 TaxID=2729111 RepID=UPI0016022200|nr:hypothetical protein [Microbispora sp. H10949]
MAFIASAWFGWLSLRFAWKGDGVAAATYGCLALVILPFLVKQLVGLIHQERASPERLIGLYRSRYVIPADLDFDALMLLERAGLAVRIVKASQVQQLGLLDGMANDLILPRQLWEIARMLRSQTSLRREQARALRGAVTPELLAVIKPQHMALQRSVQAVAKRVAELEMYARRVQEADAALRAQELLKSNDKYRDLLAHTDDLEGMRMLGVQAEATQETLARSVREAIAAGHILALPMESPSRA